MAILVPIFKPLLCDHVHNGTGNITHYASKVAAVLSKFIGAWVWIIFIHMRCPFKILQENAHFRQNTLIEQSFQQFG